MDTSYSHDAFGYEQLEHEQQLKQVHPILPKQIENHPGFLKLKPQYREPLLRFASLADPVTQTVSGDATEIALWLGLKHRQRLSDLVARWNKAGLVVKHPQRHIVDPETRRSTFVPGSCWKLLPESETVDSEKSGNTARTEATPRAEATPEATPRAACLPSSFFHGGSAVGEEQEQAGRAEGRVVWLEQELGEPITGSARSALLAALAENEDGVVACYREAKARGTNPLRLFLHLIKAGDWRTKQPARRCRDCGEPGMDGQPHICAPPPLGPVNQGQDRPDW